MAVNPFNMGLALADTCTGITSFISRELTLYDVSPSDFKLSGDR